MRCLYNIIKHLLQIATEKVSYRNCAIYPVIEFIKTNYMKNIGVREMADVIKMSELDYKIKSGKIDKNIGIELILLQLNN